MIQTIEQLQARIAELTAEMGQLKAEAINYKRQTDLAYKGSELETREQLAIAEEHNARLLSAWNAIDINSEECLDFDECTAMLVSIDDYNAMSEALSIPASREALDAYVAEKVKDARCTAEYWKENHLAGNEQIATLTRQRDLAVEALKKAREEMACTNFNSAAERIDHVLSIIKESEV